jgi:hypothetical protein
MAKGQRRSSREVMKPTQPKAKVIASASPFAMTRVQVVPVPTKTS